MIPLIGLLLALGATTVLSTYIVPGARWKDTDGNIVNAHGGCVLWDEPSEKYYLIGEYKIEEIPEGDGFAVYSSDDLAHWTFGGLALCKSICCSGRYTIY